MATKKNEQYKKVQDRIKNGDYNFQIIKFISAGSYGQIYKCIETKKPEIDLAIKIIPNQVLNSSKKLKELYDNEINILKRLNHPNICRYETHFQDQVYSYLVMEFCNSGDLLNKMLQNKDHRFNEAEALTYVRQIMDAFHELHKALDDKIIIHRDIKLENIFLHNNQVKLGDFGFAREIPKGREIAKTWCGSLYTMAPEVIESSQYGIQVDVYSIGVIFYQMLHGRFPYRTDDEKQLIKMIQKGPKIDDFSNGSPISEDTKDLLRQMLQYDPKKRISFQQLYDHYLLSPEGLAEKSRGVSANTSFAPTMKPKFQDNDLKVKLNIKVLGDFGVGKSTLIQKYVYEDVGLTKSTIGMEYHEKEEFISDDALFIRVWDTAGQEKHKTLPKIFFNDTQAFLIVFDFTNLESFTNISQFWLDQISQYSTQNVSIMVLGNKLDLKNEKGEIDKEDLVQRQQLWKQHRIMYSEASAITGENVNNSFAKLVEKMYTNYKSKELNDGKGQNQPSMKLSSNLIPNNQSKHKGNKQENNDGDEEQQSCKGGCC